MKVLTVNELLDILETRNLNTRGNNGYDCSYSRGCIFGLFMTEEDARAADDIGSMVHVRIDAPMLEGIEIDGRFAVIYSRYDISCALENQASLACDGYEEADSMKLAMNIVLYAMLQDISWSKVLSE